MTTVQINEARLQEFWGAQLATGHGNTKDTACAVDWSAYLVAGEWSDDGEAAQIAEPACNMLIRLNDRWPDETRQLLKP